MQIGLIQSPEETVIYCMEQFAEKLPQISDELINNENERKKLENKVNELI
jgi:hypothetical protein